MLLATAGVEWRTPLRFTEGEAGLIDFVYETLSDVGFTHPLHPALTHLTMGMAMGALLFAVAALRWAQLGKTALHCVVLALISIPPTIIAGIMDWQYFFDGRWSGEFIIKAVLAVVLSLLLLAAIWANTGGRDNVRLSIVLYALCFLTAIGLGYTGGEIIHG
jgi:uncharacterized membrane protein